MSLNSSSLEFTDSQLNNNNSNVKINSNIVIENNSTDITISKCDQNPVTSDTVGNLSNTGTVPLKTQMLPIVYFKNGNTKVPFALSKPSSNFSVPPATATFLNKPNSSVATIALNPNQNVIFAGRGRQVMLPKQPITLMPHGTKVSGTYLTMLKPVPKPGADLQVNLQNNEINKGVSGDTINFTNAIKLQSTSQPQKIILTGPLSKICPMTKFQSSKPSVTATTNSVQSSRFTLLPVPPIEDKVPIGQKVFNFQITDGKIISNVATQANKPDDRVPVATDMTAKASEEISNDNNVLEKNDISDKTYELSIAEEESLSNQSDDKLVVSSADSNSSVESLTIAKPPVMKFAHGVSILKKNFVNSFPQEPKNADVAVLAGNTVNNKKDIIIVKPSNGLEEKIVVTMPCSPIKKSEREKHRRKSQFNCRKDFDDMEITFMGSDSFEDCQEETTVIKEEIKEVIDEKPDITDDVKPKLEPKTESLVPNDPKNFLNMNPCDLDAIKLLTWEENIGSLAGKSDYRQLVDKKRKKAKEKEDMEREVQCVKCGCYGIRSDFVNTNFCSFDCQTSAKQITVKRPTETIGIEKASKRKFAKSKSENDIVHSNEPSGDDDTSNDTPQSKYSYPWACKKKGFSWSKYLMHMNAKAAPVKLFKEPFPYTKNGFKVGMKLEGVDPQHPSYFCVLTVADTIGYRLLLHFDGYPENYDFWSYADSLNIFPMGWCEKYGHVLRPPPGYKEDDFSWLQYLRVTKSTAAPKHLFVNRAGQAICPNGFRIGMKLEAVDKTNSSLICVATVRDMMDNRILVHFDGWDDIYDYWADPMSPYIHPVGWCDQFGHNLTPPSDYDTPENFTWEKYLKETKTVAAPVRAFKQRPACGFKRGMRLECVDKRVPHLIRVATVVDVKEHQIRVHFDGWLERYSYWVDDDCPDIHPVGWCQKTGHPLEPPLTPDDVYNFLECPTVGCRGQGNINGTKYSTHSSQKYCPYSDENIDLEKVLTDRLLSPDRSPEAKEPVSRQPKDYKTKPRIGRPPKWLKDLEATRQESSVENEIPEKKPRKQIAKKTRKKEEADKVISPTVQEKVRSFIDESKVHPAERESWKKHSEFLNDFISSGENPVSWSNSEVVEFVSSIPGCKFITSPFMEHEIDGQAFLHLSQSDILNILKYKVGPAVKLYNCIVLLREQYWQTPTKRK